jgi:hypothetical protein
MSCFAHIADPRERLRARLNLALRKGPIREADNILLDNLIEAGLLKLDLMDFDRDVFAGYLADAVEDEFGPLQPHTHKDGSS